MARDLTWCYVGASSIANPQRAHLESPGHPSRPNGAAFVNWGNNTALGNITLSCWNKLRCFVEKITKLEFRKIVSAESGQSLSIKSF